MLTSCNGYVVEYGIATQSTVTILAIGVCLTHGMFPVLQQQLLRKILSRASDTFPNLFAAVTDQFELCLTKCRTSSEVGQYVKSDGHFV